jgi:hypothetical protein
MKKTPSLLLFAFVLLLIQLLASSVDTVGTGH